MGNAPLKIIFLDTYLNGIQIIENCNEDNNIYLAYISDEKIPDDYFLSNDEKIKLYISKINNDYEPFTCQFQYACVASEPEFEEFNLYPDMRKDTGTDSSDKEDNYFEQKKYIGKYSLYNIFFENKMKTDCNNSHCELCSEDD